MGNKNATNYNFEDWVSLYANDLFKWALHKTNERESAEDLVQETFLAAFKSIENFKSESKVKTWLFSIMNNKIIDFHRKKFRQVLVYQSSLNQDGEDILDTFFDGNGSWRSDVRPDKNPDNHLLDNIRFNEVFQKCMKNLPEKWFSAIHFKYMDKKSGNEICQDLGITPSNYWKMLQRAKLQLKICLEHSWFKNKSIEDIHGI